MKKVLTYCALLCLFLCQNVLANENDSAKTKKHEENEKLFSSNLSLDFVIPLHKVEKKDEKVGVRIWGFHQFQRSHILLDIHLGYLSKWSASVEAGYNFLKKSDLWLAPKAGFSAGDYNSLGTGLFFKLNKKKVFILQNIQYNFGLTAKNSDILFSFTEIAYGPHYLEVGFISEFTYKYKPVCEEPEAAEKEWLIGPSIRGTYKNVYLEGWLGVEPFPEAHTPSTKEHVSFVERSKFVVTLGFKFSECKH